MLDLSTIHTLKLLIAILTAYFPTVAITGGFEAWLAKKFGDDTAEEAGLLTLNPWVHTRLTGLLMLLFAVLARFPLISTFGQYAQIDQFKINQPLRKLKYLLVLWSRAFMSVLLCGLAIFSWILFWYLIEVPYGLDKTHPALVSSIQLLYLIFREINIISAVLEFVLGLTRFVMSYIFPNMGEESLLFVMIVEIYLLIFSWYFIAPYLHTMVVLVESLFGYLIVGLIG